MMKPKKELSIKYLVATKRLDLLLAIELSKQATFPNRKMDNLFGQFACLYDLIPILDLNSMLLPSKEMRRYYTLFLIHDKGKTKKEIPFQLLRFAFRYLEKFGIGNQETYYIINSKNKLNILGEKE